MLKAIIVFGSTTGNTEFVAGKIGEILSSKDIEVTIKNVTNASIKELGNGYDITLLGASTWGDDEIEFQEDFEPFYEQLDKAVLKDQKVAIFGCGDSSYEHYCGAVDLLEEKMEKLDAKIVNTSLRIDGDPDGSLREIEDWTEEVAAYLLPHS